MWCTNWQQYPGCIHSITPFPFIDRNFIILIITIIIKLILLVSLPSLPILFLFYCSQHVHLFLLLLCRNKGFESWIWLAQVSILLFAMGFQRWILFYGGLSNSKCDVLLIREAPIIYKRLAHPKYLDNLKKKNLTWCGIVQDISIIYNKKRKEKVWPGVLFCPIPGDPPPPRYPPPHRNYSWGKEHHHLHSHPHIHHHHHYHKTQCKIKFTFQSAQMEKWSPPKVQQKATIIIDS